MVRLTLATLALTFLITSALVAQDRQKLIQNALSAAPASIADGAAVHDWDGNVLREGTNGWTCLPDMPDRPANSPMCLDDQFMKLIHALESQTTPNYDRVGWGYMLQGGEPGSNTKPYATGPEDAADWSTEPAPPHIMMVVPGPAVLEGMSTDPKNGGPWVMWKGTPLVHVMIPTTAASSGLGASR